ncbi:MAG: TnsA endonuclease N-terminal domain-containing protein [Anaerolineae bacterium]|nr:TnsA endonuclease N-terminal domain-containing protein [Anaerolineae bacterium]
MSRRKGIIGKVPSIKMNRMVAYESLLECDYIYLLDFDPSVTFFREQPFAIPYQWEGKKHRYTPDFHFLSGGKAFVIECKPQALLNEPGNEQKWAAARQWCLSNGATFQVVTDTDIRQGCRLENVKLLADHARHVVTPATKARVFGLLHRARQPLSIAELMVSLSPQHPQASIASILHLAYHCEVHLAVDEAPITADSLVSLSIRQSSLKLAEGG